MDVPSFETVVVDDAKVRDYLLSANHPVGRFKATVFRSLGYEQAGWHRLQTDLQTLARTGNTVRTETTPYGAKYAVSGTLTGPRGKAGRFKTIWIVSPGEGLPRFVTAIPE